MNYGGVENDFKNHIWQSICEKLAISGLKHDGLYLVYMQKGEGD